MSSLNFRKHRNRRGFFFRLSRHLPTFIVLLIIALVLGGGIFAFSHFVFKTAAWFTASFCHCLTGKPQTR